MNLLNRIVILGRPGSGKSRLALRLSSELDIPAYHTDTFGWRSGWRRTPFRVFRSKIEEIASLPRWIIDGNSPRTCDLRFPPADLIVWLEPGRWRCLFRLIFRTAKYYGIQRPTAPPKCKEQFSILLFKRFLAFDRSTVHKLHQALQAHAVEGRLIILKSQHDIDDLIAQQFRGHNTN